MRRSFLIPAAAAIFGAALLAGDAEACCHKKKVACAPAPAPCVAPAPVVECLPPPAPAPVAECAPVKKKCGFHLKMPKFGGFCHKKKAACAPAPVQCAAPAPAPCGYPAPSYGAPVASPQYMAMPSGQA